MEILDREQLLRNYKITRLSLPSTIDLRKSKYLYFYYGNKYGLYNWIDRPIHVKDDTPDALGGRLINIFRDISGFVVLSGISVILYYERSPGFPLDKSVIAIPAYMLNSKIFH